LLSFQLSFEDESHDSTPVELSTIRVFKLAFIAVAELV